MPSPVLDFLLEYEWGNMYEARDAESLRLIQDTYKCCGLKAVTDRAYPFSGPACAELYGRAASCMPSWRVAMQVSSALDFSVVVAVGLMQVSPSTPTHLHLASRPVPGTPHVSF